MGSLAYRRTYPLRRGYSVEFVLDGGRLDPPDPRHPDATFPCIKRARGAAGGIRLVTGRTKRDLTGEA